MKHSTFLLTALTFACAGPQPTTGPSKADTPPQTVVAPNSISKLISPLFEKKRTFRYKTTERVEHFNGDETEETSTEKPEVTCLVDAIGHLPNAQSWSRLSCDNDRLSAVIIASPQGVWITDTIPTMDSVKGITGKAPLLSLPPKRSKTVKNNADQVEEISGKIVTEENNAWCVRNFQAQGDESWETLCFAEDLGLISRSYGFAGGSTIETTFRLAP